MKTGLTVCTFLSIELEHRLKTDLTYFFSIYLLSLANMLNF